MVAQELPQQEYDPQTLPHQEYYPKKNNSNPKKNVNNYNAQVFWKQTRWNLSNVKNQEKFSRVVEYIK